MPEILQTLFFPDTVYMCGCLSVLVSAFTLVQSRILAFIFHRLRATLVLCLTWAAYSSLQELQMTVVLTRRIITLGRCVRVVHRAVLDQDTAEPVPAPNHLFFIQPLTPSTRLLRLHVLLEHLAEWNACVIVAVSWWMESSVELQKSTDLSWQFAVLF